MLCGCLWVWVWALATLARLTAGASSAHACFAERSDEHRLDGQWVSSRGKAPPYAECTDVLGNSKNHKCERTTEGRFYTKQETTEMFKDFQATSCVMPPMDVQDFAHVIGHGATLWFMGDSISEQMISALVCTMRAGGFKFKVEKAYKIRCYIMTHPQSKLSVRVCRMLSWLTTNLHQNIQHLDINAHKTEHQETLVLNFGLHQEKTDYSQIQDALERWQAYTPTKRKLRLVWRDTSPQHFLERGGLFNLTTHTPKLSMPCSPIDDMSAAFAPYADFTRVLSQLPEVHRLPIWSLTTPRFDAHNVHECTHFCLPGVPDVWVQLLYALLKAQPRVSTKGSLLRVPQYSTIEKAPWKTAPKKVTAARSTRAGAAL